MVLIGAFVDGLIVCLLGSQASIFKSLSLAPSKSLPALSHLIPQAARGGTNEQTALNGHPLGLERDGGIGKNQAGSRRNHNRPKHKRGIHAA